MINLDESRVYFDDLEILCGGICEEDISVSIGTRSDGGGTGSKGDLVLL